MQGAAKTAAPRMQMITNLMGFSRDEAPASSGYRFLPVVAPIRLDAQTAFPQARISSTLMLPRVAFE